MTIRQRKNLLKQFQIIDALCKHTQSNTFSRNSAPFPKLPWLKIKARKSIQLLSEIDLILCSNYKYGRAISSTVVNVHAIFHLFRKCLKCLVNIFITVGSSVFILKFQRAVLESRANNRWRNSVRFVFVYVIFIYKTSFFFEFSSSHYKQRRVGRSAISVARRLHCKINLM